MIKIGINTVSLFPSNGATIENRGTIIFNGKVNIGNNSAISLGETGKLEFGNNFSATTGLKIACYHSIKFEEDVLLGWNVQIVDTDFHSLKNDEGQKTKGFGPIRIGNNVWIANGCKLYKNTSIPSYCVVGSDTIIREQINCPPNSLIINNKDITIKTTGYFRDTKDDIINYQKS